jgi:hypothetical protein
VSWRYLPLPPMGGRAILADKAGDIGGYLIAA